MLKEEYNEYMPEIKSWEVKEYEDQFKDRVYHDVQFDRDSESDYSMKLYKGDSGVEAKWSGTIMLQGENHIDWKFSLQTPPEIDAKMSLDSENYDIISKLYNYYKIWKEEWSKMLTVPKDKEPMEQPAGEELEAGIEGQAPSLGDANISGGVGAPARPEEPILKESLLIRKKHARNKKTIIAQHSDRMRKLAGLK